MRFSSGNCVPAVYRGQAVGWIGAMPRYFLLAYVFLWKTLSVGVFHLLSANFSFLISCYGIAWESFWAFPYGHRLTAPLFSHAHAPSPHLPVVRSGRLARHRPKRPPWIPSRWWCPIQGRWIRSRRISNWRCRWEKMSWWTRERKRRIWSRCFLLLLFPLPSILQLVVQVWAYVPATLCDVDAKIRLGERLVIDDSTGGISVGGLILITVLLQFYVPSFIYLRWEALPGLCQIVLLVWAFRFRWSIHFRKWFLPEVGTVCAQPGGGVSPIAHCLWIRV